MITSQPAHLDVAGDATGVADVCVQLLDRPNAVASVLHQVSNHSADTHTHTHTHTHW